MPPPEMHSADSGRSSLAPSAAGGLRTANSCPLTSANAIGVDILDTMDLAITKVNHFPRLSARHSKGLRHECQLRLSAAYSHRVTGTRPEPDTLLAFAC